MADKRKDHKVLTSVFSMAADNELIRNNPTRRALEVVMCRNM